MGQNLDGKNHLTTVEGSVSNQRTILPLKGKYIF
jgi:hypothetical protein